MFSSDKICKSRYKVTLTKDFKTIDDTLMGLGSCNKQFKS